MRKVFLIVVLCLILAFGLSSSALAAPCLADTEGGTFSIYGENIVIFFNGIGVTYTIVDGSGLGIGLMFGSGDLDDILLNGTLSLGPVVLDLFALTDTEFDEYIGKVGAYLRLKLGPVSLYPGVGLFYAYFDADDSGGLPESDEITRGDPYFSLMCQVKAGSLIVYADGTISFGEAGVGLARVGISYGF